MKFFKGFSIFILIAVIIGGIGYIGYSFLYMNHSGHNTTTAQTQQTGDQNTNSSQPDQSMQGMQMGGTNNQAQQDSSQQNGNNQLALNQSNIILQNKEKLDKSIASINDALKLMSVDPYAPTSSSPTNMSGMGTVQQQPAGQPTQPSQGNTPAITNSGNNSTIYVFPQGNGQNAQPNSTPQNSMMQNMGTTYDANKMEQLHSGLYKISVGKALLDQLENELTSQAESATANIQNPVQYFSNQYNLAVQNKTKLGQAMTYINEAANLVNINPYVSSNGLVYDKDRMGSIHQSILKLAEGVASLNLLSDDLTRQSVSLANTVQNYINNPDTNMTMQMNTSTGLFGGLFDNISMSSVINIILIIFVIGLIAGIFGFIFSLLKPPAQKAVNRDNELV